MGTGNSVAYAEAPGSLRHRAESHFSVVARAGHGTPQASAPGQVPLQAVSAQCLASRALCRRAMGPSHCNRLNPTTVR